MKEIFTALAIVGGLVAILIIPPLLKPTYEYGVSCGSVKFMPEKVVRATQYDETTRVDFTDGSTVYTTTPCVIVRKPTRPE
jgi:hypothetical protein